MDRGPAKRIERPGVYGPSTSQEVNGQEEMEGSREAVWTTRP